jgi:hypothetical protein
MDTRYSTPGGERCQNCGRISKVVWKAPDDLWLKVIGSGSGLLCVSCFDAICAAHGITLIWKCMSEAENK